MSKVPSCIGDPKIIQKETSVYLEVTVEANPEPTAIWFKAETQIKDDDNKFRFLKENLGGDKYKLMCSLLNFEKSLAAVYKAEISNSIGKTSATFTVTAGDAPEFIEKPKIITKDGGKILGIKVHTKTKTDPQVSWTKDDQPVKVDDRVSHNMTKVAGKEGEYVCVLEIKMPEKSDEANYKCTVKNAEGSNCQSLRLAFD